MRRNVNPKDKLGAGFWQIKNGFLSTSGVSDIWQCKDATPQELLAECCPIETPEYAYWSEWQKVGRSVKLVETKRIPMN